MCGSIGSTVEAAATHLWLSLSEESTPPRALTIIRSKATWSMPIKHRLDAVRHIIIQLKPGILNGQTDVGRNFFLIVERM